METTEEMKRTAWLIANERADLFLSNKPDADKATVENVRRGAYEAALKEVINMRFGGIN